ncbi:MAG: glycosyltransferase family 9 protein [Nitrospirota bacterium]
MASRALVIQLARLGDIVQSAPAILALKAQDRDRLVDVLCPAPLATLAACLPGVSTVVPWDGMRWRALARRSSLDEAEATFRELVPELYQTVFNLNNHPLAIYAAHLLGTRVVGPGEAGPLSETLLPWAAYLRQVAQEPGANRVHLADAWCGFCGVKPTGLAPRLEAFPVELDSDLRRFTQSDRLRIAVVVGAGDQTRVIPPSMWAQWITVLAKACTNWTVVLIGGAGEHEAALAIHEALSPLVGGQVWDATGRTTLRQLAGLLACCQWVVGADTGPLHLGTAVGARAMGFYLGRARVHETGPYGIGHWVWQADPSGRFDLHSSKCEDDGFGEHMGWPMTTLGLRTSNLEGTWPVEESIELLLTGSCSSVPEGWSLWQSHLDRWGVYYTVAGAAAEPDLSREDVWRRLA